MITTLLEGVAAANSAPSAATDGVALWKNMEQKGRFHAGEGFSSDVDEVELVMFNTTYTSGVPALTFGRWWGGYRVSESSLVWVPGGTGTGNAAAATDKGRINAGAAIDGNATSFYHAERLRGLREMERIALQVGAFTGIWTLRTILISRGPVRT